MQCGTDGRRRSCSRRQTPRLRQRAAMRGHATQRHATQPVRRACASPSGRQHGTERGLLDADEEMPSPPPEQCDRWPGKKRAAPLCASPRRGNSPESGARICLPTHVASAQTVPRNQVTALAAPWSDDRLQRRGGSRGEGKPRFRKRSRRATPPQQGQGRVAVRCALCPPPAHKHLTARTSDRLFLENKRSVSRPVRFSLLGTTTDDQLEVKFGRTTGSLLPQQELDIYSHYHHRSRGGPQLSTGLTGPVAHRLGNGSPRGKRPGPPPCWKREQPPLFGGARTSPAAVATWRSARSERPPAPVQRSAAACVCTLAIAAATLQTPPPPPPLPPPVVVEDGSPATSGGGRRAPWRGTALRPMAWSASPPRRRRRLKRAGRAALQHSPLRAAGPQGRRRRDAAAPSTDGSPVCCLCPQVGAAGLALYQSLRRIAFT
ncbi:serine/arginine repetitive matrix protein 1-like [Schistocerca gregaria]|uniref:serine/arginine repetitive matrix protein 1-like n=1 Tax=Schistocerca gregaria TaxID=7010 RepID=UPI00211E1894|nr:serine/arginine repetitive matrix protein 1-like [Schistocerca gregaria]